MSVARRICALALTTIVTAGLLSGCGDGSGRRLGSTAGGSASPAAYGIGRIFPSFVDERRPTPANGDAPGRPRRVLETLILYPAGAATPGGPFPLIIFAHGFTGTPNAYEGLLQAWAGAGYVVAAPTFPLSNRNAPGGPTQADFPNQPGDITFLITQVLQLNEVDGPLRGMIDSRHIALAGHSQGASTTLGVVLNTCCRDDRITAAVVLAGNEVALPNGRFSAPDPTPVLFIHGDADDVVPYGAGRQAFADAVPPKYFVTLLGADHGRPYIGGSDAAGMVVVRTTLDFFARYLRRDAAGLERLRSDGSLTGVATAEVIAK